MSLFARNSPPLVDAEEHLPSNLWNDPETSKKINMFFGIDAGGASLHFDIWRIWHPMAVALPAWLNNARLFHIANQSGIAIPETEVVTGPADAVSLTTVTTAAHRLFHETFETVSDRIDLLYAVPRCQTLALCYHDSKGQLRAAAAITYLRCDNTGLVVYFAVEKAFRRNAFGTFCLVLLGKCILHRGHAVAKMLLLANMSKNPVSAKFYTERGFMVRDLTSKKTGALPRVVNVVCEQSPEYQRFIRYEEGDGTNWLYLVNFARLNIGKESFNSMLNPKILMNKSTGFVDDEACYCQFPGGLSFEDMGHCVKDLVVFQHLVPAKERRGIVKGASGLPLEPILTSWADRCRLDDKKHVPTPIIATVLNWITLSAGTERVAIVPLCVLESAYQMQYLHHQFLLAPDESELEHRQVAFHDVIDEQRFMEHAEIVYSYVRANPTVFDRPYIACMYYEYDTMQWTCLVAINAFSQKRKAMSEKKTRSMPSGKMVCGYVYFDPCAESEYFESATVQPYNPSMYFLSFAFQMLKDARMIARSKELAEELAEELAGESVGSEDMEEVNFRTFFQSTEQFVEYYANGTVFVGDRLTKEERQWFQGSQEFVQMTLPKNYGLICDEDGTDVHRSGCLCILFLLDFVATLGSQNLVHQAKGNVKLRPLGNDLWSFEIPLQFKVGSFLKNNLDLTISQQARRTTEQSLRRRRFSYCSLTISNLCFRSLVVLCDRISQSQRNKYTIPFPTSIDRKVLGLGIPNIMEKVSPTQKAIPCLAHVSGWEPLASADDLEGQDHLDFPPAADFSDHATNLAADAPADHDANDHVDSPAADAPASAPADHLDFSPAADASDHAASLAADALDCPPVDADDHVDHPAADAPASAPASSPADHLDFLTAADASDHAASLAADALDCPPVDADDHVDHPAADAPASAPAGYSDFPPAADPSDHAASLAADAPADHTASLQKLWCQYPPPKMRGVRMQYSNMQMEQVFEKLPLIKMLFRGAFAEILPPTALSVKGSISIERRLEHTKAKGTKWMAGDEIDLMIATLLSDGRYRDSCFVFPCGSGVYMQEAFRLLVVYDKAKKLFDCMERNNEDATKIEATITSQFGGKTFNTIQQDHIISKNGVLKNFIIGNPGLLSHKVLVFPKGNNAHWSVVFVFNASRIDDGIKASSDLCPSFFRCCSMWPHGHHRDPVNDGIQYFLNLCYSFEKHQRVNEHPLDMNVELLEPYGNQRDGKFLGTESFPALHLNKASNVFPRQVDGYNCGIGLCASIAIMLRDVLQNEESFDNLFASLKMHLQTCSVSQDSFCEFPEDLFTALPGKAELLGGDYLTLLREEWFVVFDRLAKLQHEIEAKAMYHDHQILTAYSASMECILQWPNLTAPALPKERRRVERANADSPAHQDQQQEWGHTLSRGIKRKRSGTIRPALPLRRTREDRAAVRALSNRMCAAGEGCKLPGGSAVILHDDILSWRAKCCCECGLFAHATCWKWRRKLILCLPCFERTKQVRIPKPPPSAESFYRFPEELEREDAAILEVQDSRWEMDEFLETHMTNAGYKSQAEMTDILAAESERNVQVEANWGNLSDEEKQEHRRQQRFIHEMKKEWDVCYEDLKRQYLSTTHSFIPDIRYDKSKHHFVGRAVWNQALPGEETERIKSTQEFVLGNKFVREHIKRDVIDHIKRVARTHGKFVPVPKAIAVALDTRIISHVKFCTSTLYPNGRYYVRFSDMTEEPIELATLEDLFPEAYLSRVRLLFRKGFINIPAGNVMERNWSAPVQSTTRPCMTVHYRQGEQMTCVYSSFASALHAVGLQGLAALLAERSTESDGNPKALSELARYVQSNSWLQPFKIRKQQHFNLLTHDLSSGFAVVVLCASDGTRSHAVTVHDEMVFDGNEPHAIPVCQDNLDYLCSTTARKGKFVGVAAGYVFLEQGKRNRLDKIKSKMQWLTL